MYFQSQEIYFLKGAIEYVLKSCTYYVSPTGRQPMNSKQSEIYIQQAASLGTTGLRGIVNLHVILSIQVF